MPDGVSYIFNEITRKLSLAKIASSHKGKELIDDVLYNDLPKLKQEVDLLEDIIWENELGEDA